MIEELNMTFVDGQTIINAEMLSAFQNKINELVRKANEGGEVPIGTDVFDANTQLSGGGKYWSLANGKIQLEDNPSYNAYAIPIEPNVLYENRNDSGVVPAGHVRFGLFADGNVDRTSNAIGSLLQNPTSESTTDTSAKYLLLSIVPSYVPTIKVIKKSNL